MQLAHLGTGLYLSDEKVGADVRDARQERFGLVRILEEPRLCFLQGLAAATLDHVREQRPRGTAEADQRHLAVQCFSRHRDGLKDVAQLFVHVHLGAQLRDVVGRVQRVGERGPRVHEDLHAQCLGDDEDVAEDDRCIDETGVAADGLDGDFCGQRGGTTDLEEFVVQTHFPEFYSRLSVCAVASRVYYVPGRYRPAWRMTHTGARSVSSPRREMQYERPVKRVWLARTSRRPQQQVVLQRGELRHGEAGGGGVKSGAEAAWDGVYIILCKKKWALAAPSTPATRSDARTT